MDFNSFKKEALNTGYSFTYFCDWSGCFSAEIPSKEKYVGLYYPNKFNGFTLVTGFGKDKRIEFFKSIDDIKGTFCTG